MKKKIIVEDWEIEHIINTLKSILGYCGSWDNNDIISVKRETGHVVSMTVSVFLEQLEADLKFN